MAEIVRRTFRVTLDVTVSLNEIDEALIENHHKYFADLTLATHPETLEAITRDRRLLAAVLATPDVLSRVLIQCAANSLEYINVDDATLRDLQTNQRTEAQIIEDLREVLPPADYEYHCGSCEAGLFYDSSMYFQDAFTMRQHHVAIQARPDD